MGQEKTQRKLDSIFLEPGLKQSIVSDLKNFLTSQDWYESCGVPYKRSYLFHGPPGCGKTSTIMAIAGIFNAFVKKIIFFACESRLQSPSLAIE